VPATSETPSGRSAPRIAVVAPSHDRPLRLRWLLNALEEQTLGTDAFEVVICHDSRGPETEALLREHPLAAAGVLRHVTLEPGSGPPGLQRNRGWRLAAAPLIAFTDDDCLPPPEWLARALEAARIRPGQVVQGSTRPDPDELSVALHAPHARSQTIDPPVPWAQTCNIVYPRSLLDRLGGFDETMDGGEDAELAQRAIAAGAILAGAPEVLTYHAVHARGLLGTLRTLPRWQHLAGLVKRHPALRRSFTARLFWRETHPLLLLGAGGILLARRPGLGRYRATATLLVLPWALRAAPSYGASPRGRVRAAAELPGRAVLDIAEIAVLARGSIRYRTLLL
jgi:glycosyltransferase involved in cell wall biosynthesis